MSTATTNSQFGILKREFGTVRRQFHTVRREFDVVRRLQTRNAYANIRLGALRLGMPMKSYGSVQSNVYRAICTLSPIDKSHMKTGGVEPNLYEQCETPRN